MGSKTFGAGKATAWKERKKVIAKSVEGRKEFLDKINNLKGIEKLEYDIKFLKSTIINCKFDLTKNPENEVIREKMNLAAVDLEMKQKMLQELKDKNKNKDEK